MTLYEELYFEITLKGQKSKLKRAVSALRSGELDEYFEMSSDYLIYDDGFDAADDDAETEIIFTTDDYGIPIEELEAEEFLETFCKITKDLDVFGYLYDVDEEEHCFSSSKGDSYYINSRKAMVFNDELDAVAMDEEAMANDE